MLVYVGMSTNLFVCIWRAETIFYVSSNFTPLPNHPVNND